MDTSVAELSCNFQRNKLVVGDWYPLLLIFDPYVVSRLIYLFIFAFFMISFI